MTSLHFGKQIQFGHASNLEIKPLQQKNHAKPFCYHCFSNNIQKNRPISCIKLCRTKLVALNVTILIYVLK